MVNVKFEPGDLILAPRSKRVVRVLRIQGRLLVLEPVNFVYTSSNVEEDGTFTFDLNRGKYAISSGNWKKITTQAERLLYV